MAKVFNDKHHEEFMKYADMAIEFIKEWPNLTKEEREIRKHEIEAQKTVADNTPFYIEEELA